MRFASLLSLLPTLALLGCASHRPESQQSFLIQSDSELIITSGPSNRNLTIAEMSRALPLETVTVNDPVYQKCKRYEGFWLDDVLRLGGIKPDADNVLVFSALDGYQARLSHLPGPPTRGLVAVRDLDQKQGWETLQSGKEKVTPGPFYLVWQSHANTAQSNVTNSHLLWPYQINRIELLSAFEAQRRLLPTASNSNSNVTRGYDLFAKHCLTCHSVNLEGGALGPELNIPKSITEYRNSAYLIEFIRAPSSFRARSKMPDFGAQLSDKDITDILTYLHYMQQRKVLLR